MSDSIKCPFCAEEIKAEASKCKHCHEYLKPTNSNNVEKASSQSFDDKRGIAAALSTVAPGLGQIYKGEILKGIICGSIVVFGYMLLVIPGAAFHLICIYDAYSYDPNKKKIDTQSVNYSNPNDGC